MTAPYRQCPYRLPQPAIEVMCSTFAGTEYDTGLDLRKMIELADYWKEIRPLYKEFDLAQKYPDAGILVSQVPGGMMSNFLSQLKQANALHRLPEVLEEMPRVQEDFGWPRWSRHPARSSVPRLF